MFENSRSAKDVFMAGVFHEVLHIYITHPCMMTPLQSMNDGSYCVCHVLTIRYGNNILC